MSSKARSAAYSEQGGAVGGATDEAVVASGRSDGAQSPRLGSPADGSVAATSPRMDQFVDADEPRFSCLVCPTKNGEWWWSIFSGDGSEPGSLKRGSSMPTLALALDAAAEWARHYDGDDEHRASRDVPGLVVVA